MNPSETPADAQEHVLPPPPRKRRLSRRTLLIAAGALVVLTAAILYYLVFIAPFESTDDAFIDGYATLVSSRVPGQVVQLLVRDNQSVRQGQVLIRLDPRDYEASLSQASAALASARSQEVQARAQLQVSDARVTQAQASESAVEADAQRADNDLKRYQSVEKRAVSKTILDQISTQARSTAAQLRAARSQLAGARAEVALSQAAIQTAAAAVRVSQARVRQAELNLSYTTLVAPVDARVTARSVDAGNYVQPGQGLLVLVPKYVWVTANFKETQLARMRPGQRAEMRLDAYPGYLLKGHVDSLQAGTGARFSLLPPENAVGNYVKVVQRVPVKIVFDGPLPAGLDIAPGMSVVPWVRIK
ncbi:MAG TPA: HlyD family secretion protein [Steroidobacteraceae bacterium]|nr:HlyD family secretion protein [Steroidobacteraceae bacterium]